MERGAVQVSGMLGTPTDGPQGSGADEGMAAEEGLLTGIVATADA